MAMKCVTLFAFLAVAHGVTPIDKVINLIDNMKKEVEKDGAAEAKAYGKYACFCKSTTATKSTSVKDGNDKIDSLSADIADKTQSQKSDSTELSERKVKQETLSTKLDATNTRCASDKAEYETEAADLSKAISSLKNAKKSMVDSKPKAALLQTSMKEDLLETLAMAEALNMIATPKRQAVTAMIQGQSSVDPSDPEYEFHGNDIIDLLTSLHKDFTDEKKTLDTEWGKTKKACDELKASLKKDMGSNSDSVTALTKNIAKLAKEIAGHREDLVESEATMKDDEVYLKDLTAQCEARANDFDQRSSMRNDEVTALATALKILRGDGKSAADKVNVRALLQATPVAAAAPKAVVKAAAAPKAAVKVEAAAAPKAVVKAAAAVKKPVSFLQSNSLTTDARKMKALALLAQEGDRLSSFVLTSLAQRSAGDPFTKIKGLIQKLIERLIAEATAEATKKGFCDTELGKARKERDFRFVDTNDLSSDLETLEAKEDALNAEITLLKKQLKAENTALTETTSERKEEKSDNLSTLATAKEGLSAIREALLTLRSFYAQAAKASLIQASPVDEDTSGPGFGGSYSGNQSGSKAVLSLLETIESDFDRTIRTTEASEEQAHRDFVKFSQATKSSIASKEQKQELDEQDLKTTETNLKTKMEDLETAQSLLDDALKELEGLQSTCVDTGMSYKQRVEKREEEMKALGVALCILDTDKVEADCK